MKRFVKYAVPLACLLFLLLAVVGCGGSQGASEENSEKAPEAAKSTTSKGFATIQEYVEVVCDIEGQHEGIINQYEGMPVLELHTALLPIATVPVYDLHNLDGKDGRFEGVGMGSGMPEFIEKRGSQFTFGRDGIRENDGISPDDKKGDRIVENGSLDGERGYFRAESFAERNGAKFKREVTQSNLIEGESVAILHQFGKSLDTSRNTNVFILAGKENYDFVIAEGDMGTDFQEILLDFASVEKAIEAFEANGFAVTKTGGIADGKFFVNEH